MTSFLFDTNTFTSILNGSASVSSQEGRLTFYVTHIQFDEIQQTQDPVRKEELIRTFRKIDAEMIPTRGAYWNISGYNASTIDDIDDSILESIKQCDKKSGKNKTGINQARDALIANTAIKNNIILVTDDKCLGEVVRQHHGIAITFHEFRRIYLGTH